MLWGLQRGVLEKILCCYMRFQRGAPINDAEEPLSLSIVT